ncbi:MAG: hypothetical protein QI199_08555 [Candidatus Korarchaeota archaeon]|nr:hypothetical protein [Candidatus Korarchaeota archaeon]
MDLAQYMVSVFMISLAVAWRRDLDGAITLSLYSVVNSVLLSAIVSTISFYTSPGSLEESLDILVMMIVFSPIEMVVMVLGSSLMRFLVEFLPRISSGQRARR